MKKIYIVLDTGEEIFVAHATSLYNYFKATRNKVIVPFNGNLDYILVKNIYYPKLKQFVSYKSV